MKSKVRWVLTIRHRRFWTPTPKVANEASGKTILSAAANCLQCGMSLDARNPDKRFESAGKCPDCSGAVRKIKGLQGTGEFAVFFVLFCLGLFPGLLYYMWAENTPYCLDCRRRVKHPQPI